MKKLFVLAASALLLSACAKENIKPNEPTDQNEERPLLEIGLNTTKTALGTEDAGKFPIVWSEGDEIAVIDNMGVEGKQNISVYRLKEGVGTAQGLFEHVSGDAFPKVINDVVYPASVVDPKSTFLSETLITDVTKLVPKEQKQAYTKNSFDPNYAVMYFHRNTSNEPIKLSPISTIVCFPIKGFDDNDVVTAVRWQSIDGRIVDITLNCPTEGVKLSKNQATNFYLSAPATAAGKDAFNSIVYVYLKNGAVQVKTPRNRERFEAGTLHRFPEWQLSKKAKWTFKYVGSEREHAMTEQTPLGPAAYMIDGNDISWWEFRRKLNTEETKGAMAGPHKVIIDLGKTEHIKGLRIKGPETKLTASYSIKNSKGVDIDMTPSQGYSAPAVVFASFLKEGELTQTYIDGFNNNSSFESKAQEKFYAVTQDHTNEKKPWTIIKTPMTQCYGKDMKSYWNLPLKEERDARYLVIHFYQCWNDGATGGAASKMKVAELDIY